MARLAVVTEVERLMIRRSRSAIEIRNVTLIAVRVRELIIPVRVAAITREACMRALQSEVRVGVIERRWTPRVLRMALRTGMRELIRDVIGILRLIEIRLMTLIAIDVREIVIPICMACVARLRLMRAQQWEVRVRVIERRWTPCVLTVTAQTIVRKLIRDVMRILCLVERVRVALPAIRVGHVIITGDVACITRLRLMRSH